MQPVLLMLFLKCVQSLPFCFIYLTLSKYQIWNWSCVRTAILGSPATCFFSKGLILSMKWSSYDFLSDSLSWKVLRKGNILNSPSLQVRSVLKLAIVGIGRVLYVALKYLFALSIDSLFLLYILLCVLDK